MVDQSLSARKEAILLAVIVEYIRTAAPVGSQHVLESAELSLSPASVRSQMANLEKEGYLTQPHVSAGRIPSIRGYRYFVDRLLRFDPVELAQIEHDVTDFLQSAKGALEDVLERSLTFLSQQTNYTAVMTTWTQSTESYKALQTVCLGPEALLVIVVGSKGSVERTTIRPGVIVDDELATELGRRFTAALAGRDMAEPIDVLTLADSVLGVAPDGSGPDAQISSQTGSDLRSLVHEVATAVGELRVRADVGLRVRELSKTAAALEQLDQVAKVLETLEHDVHVVDLIRSLIATGSMVSIGDEGGLEALNECSLVVAPCEIDGELVGSIGLIGPTRMDYSRALAAVEALSAQVAHAVR
ncbi:MAG: heat-inducible transcriptional repressor HrcA [Ferrimicrobium sp.]|jgi:heat-inducible transcriptional repressor|uniref:Heat-inducible transcription repressor HrcA n=1 Tax=Ferrimicrobium acidiphilum TaxID=121039 RepID=A0ABV3Y2Y4_9ACTN|nr:heat-inducible transcriptional repressor HrcA [Ferrimicrobium sp.]MCL5973597.1 heat-inducible transcriptional repressor HrcA [Actinomycetota bacterium]